MNTVNALVRCISNIYDFFFFFSPKIDLPDLPDLPEDEMPMLPDDHEMMLPHMRDDYTIRESDDMSEVNYIQDKGMAIIFYLCMDCGVRIQYSIGLYRKLIEK